jgi:hypothetical protein
MATFIVLCQGRSGRQKTDEYYAVHRGKYAGREPATVADFPVQKGVRAGQALKPLVDDVGYASESASRALKAQGVVGTDRKVLHPDVLECLDRTLQYIDFHTRSRGLALTLTRQSGLKSKFGQNQGSL